MKNKLIFLTYGEFKYVYENQIIKTILVINIKDERHFYHFY